MIPDLRLVIFDVDGTLVDSQAEILGAMTQAFTAVDLAVPGRAQILSIVGLSLPETFCVLCPDLDKATRDELTSQYRASFHDHATADLERRSPLFPGALDALQRLQAQDHTLLAVATGKSKRGLDRLVDEQALQGLFVSSQTSDFHPSKPHPSMVLTCLADAGVTAGRAVMIGDTSYDMDMARAAGVATIGVGWGYHAPDTLGADRLIDTFAALDAAIDDLIGDPV